MQLAYRPSKRLLAVTWKLAVILIIAGVAIYRLRFAPVPVASHVASAGPIVSEVMGTGTLEPRIQSTVGPKLSGLIAEVLFDEGDRVTRGEVVAILDDSDQQKQVAMAEADVEVAKATLDRAAADISIAKATADYAQLNYERIAGLNQFSAASKDEWAKAIEQRDVATAQLKRAELAKVEADRQVIKASHTLRYYQQLLANTRITAPFDGLVVRRTRDPGTMVVPGSEILQIISTEQLWVSAWVDETAMASVHSGQLARVIFRSQPGRPHTGTVTRMAPMADRETREFIADVTVEELPENWAVGQRAEVFIQTASKDRTLLVPQAAIVWQKGKSGLFVNNNGRAAWRDVELGLRSQRGVQMVEITSGLSAGETVIWMREPKDGRLKPGQAVELVNTQ